MPTHYRRMFWLFVFGMIHAYFLWWGDILVYYAVAGLLIFPFRKLSPRGRCSAMGVGDPAGALLVQTLIGAGAAGGACARPPAAPGASAGGGQGVAGSLAFGDRSAARHEGPGDRRLRRRLHGRAQGPRPDGHADAAGADAHGDGLPEAIGQMFIGMALFRLGFFTLGWSTRAYGAD